MTPIAELERQVARHFREHAADFGLVGDRVCVRYVVNMGGFVCAGFAVSDGASTYHLKLAREEEQRSKLRRWLSLGDYVAERYRAPRTLGWVDLGAWGGLLLEGLPGTALDVVPGSLMGDVLRVVEALPRSIREVPSFWWVVTPGCSAGRGRRAAPRVRTSGEVRASDPAPRTLSSRG